MGIGNDVMDLGHRSCRAREPGDRLLGRILDPAEYAWLEQHQPGGPWSTPLWALWAAKEAAFKASSKKGASAGVFSPTTLVCELLLTSMGSPTGRGDVISIRGTVRGESLEAPVSVRGTSDGEHLHVIGWSVPDSGATARVEAGVERVPEGSDLESLRTRFTNAEWEGVHSTPSAIVRLEARERLRAMISEASGEPVDPAAIEILTAPGLNGSGLPGRTPPSLRIDGRTLTGWDVSLSHHGRYVAWALTQRRER